MKLTCFTVGKAGRPRLGLYTDAGIVEVKGRLARKYPSVRAVIEKKGFPEIARWAEGRKPDHALARVRYLPPLWDAEKVICVGVNYPKRHPVEGKLLPPPEHITLFAKWEGALVGHREPLALPRPPADRTFDYEGELALVIGRDCRRVPKAKAMSVIAGFTILNDGSVRDWQKHSVPAGKNFTGSGASGPCFVSKDEIKDVRAMRLSTRLNGEEVQMARVADMIFDVPTIVEYVSGIMRLRPGDVISTGSPAGSGGSRVPQRFLKAGDRLEIEWTGLGVLENKVKKG
jgi:2-keto-4-pentenoate hydratase/2-oxohepta-3-ene-1,7-dioic acid hydratase in catechol pathway